MTVQPRVLALIREPCGVVCTSGVRVGVQQAGLVRGRGNKKPISIRRRHPVTQDKRACRVGPRFHGDTDGAGGSRWVRSRLVLCCPKGPFSHP